MIFKGLKKDLSHLKMLRRQKRLKMSMRHTPFHHSFDKMGPVVQSLKDKFLEKKKEFQNN